MTERSHFPETFDEVVRLVVLDQIEAAGALWDRSMEQMAEDVFTDCDGDLYRDMD
jgi:hypothetical protein